MRTTNAHWKRLLPGRGYSFGNLILGTILLLGNVWPAGAQTSNKQLYRSDSYQIYSDKVVQPPFEAKAISATEIISNYQSPSNEFVNPRIDFKFSINGKDNEMESGRDHHFNCIAENGYCQTPLIEFGKQLDDKSEIPSGLYLKPNTKFTIRLDMRKVFSQFEERGYYEAFNGSKIYKSDFKGVFVAGGMPPLTWDFDNLHNFRNLELKDDDGDHIYELTLVLNSKQDQKKTTPVWKQTLNTSAFPQYKSDFVLLDALYNMSLEEMIRAVEKDSTLRTGKEWAGVWTRDVSYSIILSMAILQTKVAQYSLMRKVKDGIIIQDTGTGGAYPISTDRMVWAVAAWEIYKVTGDKKWLSDVYPIIKKSLEADLQNATDPVTGLVKGESSFLDWREQTYPEWMEPSDIYESQCLGTNAVHYQAHQVLASMANELKQTEVASKHSQIADGIKKAVNRHLWLNDKGYYAQFLYGRNFKSVSPKSEALGEALAVLFDIADPARQNSVIENTPVNVFGIPCIYPQIPNIPPYHNNAVWPFVQSYWALASAKTGNETAVLQSLSAIYRPAALFLTNKENFVASNGDYASTQINSDNMLWSLSGNLAMVYKVLFGMQYDLTSLTFKPLVPQALRGKRTITNYKYRNAVLDIEMEGFGNKIKSITIDGKVLKDGKISADLSGRHVIKIELANNTLGGKANILPHAVSPGSPRLSLQNSTLSWNTIDEATKYKLLKNGSVISTQTETNYAIRDEFFAEFQVIAVDKNGFESFASEPLLYTPGTTALRFEVEEVVIKDSTKVEQAYKGYSGSGYVETSLKNNASLNFKVTLPDDGLYAVDFRYANGNGPVNTENKCAIRTLTINEKSGACIVFPQRGKEEWSDWGFTNSILNEMKKGSNQVSLGYKSHNANMNGEINEAVIDYIRIIRVK